MSVVKALRAYAAVAGVHLAKTLVGLWKCLISETFLIDFWAMFTVFTDRCLARGTACCVMKSTPVMDGCFTAKSRLLRAALSGRYAAHNQVSSAIARRPALAPSSFSFFAWLSSPYTIFTISLLNVFINSSC